MTPRGISAPIGRRQDRWASGDRVRAWLDSRVGRSAWLHALLVTLLGLVLGLVRAVAAPADAESLARLDAALLAAFAAIVMIAGSGAWLYTRALERKRIAEADAMLKSALLAKEAAAHRCTDAALQKAREMAEAANRTKNRYIAGMTHELRTPLSAIMGYAQLLDADPAIPDASRAGIAVIRRSAEHLSGLIDGLLDISKIEAGRLRLERNEVRLAEFLDQLIGMFRLQAQAKGLEFIFEQEGPTPVAVTTDERQLRQILINLLSNAIKFTDVGRVTLRLRFRSEVAEFTIADTGVGILDSDQARIFEPFERGELTRALAAPGSGLGLTITKILTEVMGGEISVESRPGKGTVFRVRLMLLAVARPRAQLAPADRRIVGYSGARRTILVVDDDAAHRDLMREILGGLGFVVLAANDGPSGLALAEKGKPDLALLDISLPGMSGWEVARSLSQFAGWSCPIIMISALTRDAAVGGQGLARGPVMSKPFSLPELLGRVQNHLGLDWIVAASTLTADSPLLASPPRRPAAHHVEELRRLGQIGFVRGIESKLDEIERLDAGLRPFVLYLRQFLREFDLRGFVAAVEAPPADERA